MRTLEYLKSLTELFKKEDRPVTTKKVIKRIIPKVSLSLDI